MGDAANAFLEESNALHVILSPLSDSELQLVTGFKNYTLENVIGHLHVWNLAADLTLKDGAKFQEFFQEVMTVAGAGGGLPAFEKKFLADKKLSGRALVAAWREQYQITAKRYGDADPKQRVKWAGPDMTARSKITARLMETWAHGQEVYDQLGLVRQNADRIRNVVQLGVSTYGWTFAVRGEKPAGPMPHLRLKAPSGELWTYGDASETELIEGDAHEFCQVVTQTRNIKDTQLKVVGPCATAWMSKAQCFAGAAEEPPPPGTRKLVPKAKM